MYTKNLPTLRIHKLSQEQYDREAAAGNIENFSLYLTPEVDSIIAEDLKGGLTWRWRKWASGLAEFWIKSSYETTPYVISESFLDGFSYCRVHITERPFPLVRLYGSFVNISSEGDAYYIQDKTSGSSLYFHTNDPSIGINYFAYAIGEWKETGK